MDQANERPPMGHPIEPKPDTREDRLPMVHHKTGLSRRIQIGLAKIGLLATVATGGAGTIHHVTGIDLGGPIPVGAAADIVESTAVDSLIKLTKQEPQQEQANLNQEKAATIAFFKPTKAQVGGQIEIDLAKLSEARTEDILLAIRLGNDYEKIDVSKIKAFDNLSTEPGSKFIVDNPTVVDLTTQGLGKYFTATIETDKGMEPVLLPEASVTITKPGNLEPLSAVTNSNTLNVAHKLYPTK